MHTLFNKRLLIAVTVIAILVITGGWIIHKSSNKIDFSTQVKPIINRSCISCHGGVKAKGGFSLLFREEALAKTKDSIYAIIPGDADGSEMIRRLTSKDPEERMPYQHAPLPKEEIEILRKWIDQGAQWGDHWAYIPLKPVEVPQPKKFFGLFKSKSAWAQNEVDNFIEDKFSEANLKPSPQADKATLLRRVSLDIIGMQPSDNIANKFLQSNDDNAYNELVDSLLASKHFGEKWASMWLDLARYADTKGYERDAGRNIWRYRDWLIDAFNNDMPYDSFLIKQIAGDLLKGATDADYIATAFNRNTMTNDEGGTDNEEFRTAAVLDRVNTTWYAVMGTTFSCVQCHSHPYDPFKHEDYYKFMAFFNDTRDEDTEADYPLLRTYNNDTLQQELSTVVNWIKQNVSDQKSKEVYTFLKTWQPAYNSLTCDSFTNSELNDTKWTSFRNHAVCRLKNVDLNNRDRLIFRYQGWVAGGVWQIHLDSANGETIATIPLPQTNDWQITETTLKPSAGVHNLIFTYINNNLKKPVDAGALLDWLYFTQEFPGKDKQGYAVIKDDYWKLLKANVPTTPIMMDNPKDMHRATYVFERGNWLTKGDEVTPGVPASLNTFPKNAPQNRLGLALWITSKQNPLTARTMANRVWEQLFGTGLAETLEDLGTQGSPPTHAELLDFLSYQFMHDDHWSMKALIKKIVTSATYKQDSRLTPELEQKDPQNKFYARAPRIRLSAEQLRDQSLCISGLMSAKMYGPGVMPYQPKGIWLSPWNGADWVQSEGEDQYRRAVYTYWKRSSAYPSMLAFDGVSRELCSARRIRTNTPLQALTTLNDSAYIDAARHFAYRLQQYGGDVKTQISKGFQLATYQSINDKSLNALLNLYNKALHQFNNNKKEICEMTGGMNEHTNAATAALIVVANAILNLDEVVTKN
ncbi:MAG: DUF1553 domain-containing protein [Parafilimonas sp.]